MSELKEKTTSSERKYTGKIINVRHDEVVLSDGKEHFREIVEHSGGVVMVPVTVDNRLVMVSQWRHPVQAELIELPAGKLEKNEDPFEAAKRELEEETGYVSSDWEFLGYAYSSPGFCDEKLHFYKASNLVYSGTNPDWGEIVNTHVFEINEVINMIKSGKIVDAKTVAGVFYITND